MNFFKFPEINRLLLLLTGICIIFLYGCSNGGGHSRSAAAASPESDLNTSPTMLALSTFLPGGLTAPVGFETPGDGTDRIFIIEQGGTIQIIQNGSLLPSPFLDIRSKLESGGEKGLLGLAFHPDFTSNGRFFINYTRRVNGQLESVISEVTVSAADPNLADAASERLLLTVNQPSDNHNGGQLAFGPDGFLYIALGDGGGSGDLSGNAQNLQTLLGKILRIDVDSPPASGKQYAVPSDNPFATGGGLPEIWAYGLRNPWRFSFDPTTSRLFAGDVGQGSREEIDLITRGGNFGWNIMEGNHCFPPGTSSCDATGLIPPITEYPNPAEGTAVIGGFVYRGIALPGLKGAYIFGDLSSGNVWGLQQDSQGSWRRTLLLTHDFTLSSFGRDAAGELYLIDFENGAVLRLTAAP